MSDDTRDLAADAVEIGLLAALDPMEYDRKRLEAAERLNVRVSTLDERVKAVRPKPEATHGRTLALPEVEPWPQPVALGDVLHELALAVRRHVILPPSAADCISLWIAHTWVYEEFQHSPRLSITSPVKRCGKSTLLDVLRAACHRPLKADNVSPSGVFRAVEATRPLSLLVDEADSFLGDNEELRGILNSGYEASGEVIRVVEVKDEWQPIRFATFCPVALASIGPLPGTLEDRALPIVLQRKATAETVTKLRAVGARDALNETARKLARWAADRRRFLPADPAVPDALGDREGDISIPLLSIADDAGGEWPVRGRKALLEVFEVRAAMEGTTDTGTLLLSDIKSIFVGTSAPRITSAHIVDHLSRMEERPWPEWRHGKPMTAHQLARALNPFGVRPSTIRIRNETAKGYNKDAFKEVWNRYLPAEASTSPSMGVPEPSHRHNPSNSWVWGENQAVTAGSVLRTGRSGNSTENLACDGVTVPAALGSRSGDNDEVKAEGNAGRCAP